MFNKQDQVLLNSLAIYDEHRAVLLLIRVFIMRQPIFGIVYDSLSNLQLSLECELII